MRRIDNHAVVLGTSISGLMAPGCCRTPMNASRWWSAIGVDATGRGGRMATWLQALGYQPPAEDQLAAR